ncbi:hypothetical protein KR067_004806 [Drosophila pandora]|nr:hypothetical protein KR067_004806 [Drosophila pandora]
MYRISPIGRKSNFHSREKCLIGLVLVTLCFLCFGGIFLLPDNFGGDRVLREEREAAGGDHQAANPVLAAPVQGDGGGAAAGSQSSHPQANSGQQTVLPLGGGGNEQAPDTLDATLEERRQKVKEG